eukprot:358582-Chlamydomonas_euryale.AAC.7
MTSHAPAPRTRKLQSSTCMLTLPPFPLYPGLRTCMLLSATYDLARALACGIQQQELKYK